MKKRHLNTNPWIVLVAILLAMVFGSYVGKEGHFFNVPLYPLFDTISTMFLNALTLIVVPLVFSSIVSGIAQIGKDEAFGRIGIKVFLFYLGTNLLAVLIGLFFVNLFVPGHFVGTLPEQETMITQHQIMHSHTLATVLRSIIPSNILHALSQGEMLSLIFFSLLFGYAVAQVDSEKGEVVKTFFQGIFQVMIRFTHIIMQFLPYGVFCLVAKVFMTTGFTSLTSIGFFTLTVVFGLTTFMFLALPLVLRFVGNVSPLRHFQAMGPALITAFSTSSSSATLPITIDCVEKRAKVSNRICSLVVPLGTSINMSGSALYECVAAVFIAQAYGIDLSYWTQFLIVLLSLIASMGVVGVPSSGLMAILIILKAIGLPPEGIGLVVAVERLLDMCRTTVNVFSDSCCAVLVAKTEGEKQVLQDLS